MPFTRWAVTFDDGPLPADLYAIHPANPAEALAPLEQILHVLATYSEGPVPATFFVRGPAYPWTAPPPASLFEDGILQIRQADPRHEIGLHCHRHDPGLWYFWWLRSWQDIIDDLDAALEFFGPMSGAQPMFRFRPPYGQGGPGGRIWASQHEYVYHSWDLDSEDWRHHRDSQQLGFGAFQQDSDAPRHLQHITDVLTFWIPWVISPDTPKEILLHVSRRTASYLPAVLDVVCNVTRRWGFEPLFVPPVRMHAPDIFRLESVAARSLPASRLAPRPPAAALPSLEAGPPRRERELAPAPHVPPAIQLAALDRAALQARVDSDREARYAAYIKQMTAPAEPFSADRAARVFESRRRLRILAEGDSWFEYPLRGWVIGDAIDGVIYRLEKLLGYPIANMAHHGDEVRQMLGLGQRVEIRKRLSDPFVRFDALLFSGGGNDLVGDQFCLWLRDAVPDVPPEDLLYADRVQAALACLEAGYRDLIALRNELSPQTVIFVHGYDFPPVTGRRVCNIGPWLKPSLDFRGVPVGQDQYAVVRALLQQFQAMLERVAATEANVVVVQTQNTLAATDADWQNEIHPSADGFAKIARKFAEALEERFA